MEELHHLNVPKAYNIGFQNLFASAMFVAMTVHLQLIINDRNPNFNERISFSAIQKSSLAIAYLSVVVKTVFTETDHKANYSKSLPSAAFANAPKSLMGRAICPVSKNLKQGLQWLELHQVLPFQV